MSIAASTRQSRHAVLPNTREPIWAECAVCVQPSDTADIVTALEEGQLILGGLASNR